MTNRDSLSADGQELLLRQWLYLVAGLVLVLIMLGEISRLDHSGPPVGTFGSISNFLPPLSAHDWQRLFDRFRQVPGFGVDEAAGMSLAQFEHAYLWEWAHLLTQHAIDIVLATGIVVLLARVRRGGHIGYGFQVLILLGAGHAVLGWWLGMSGLTHRKSLAQFVIAANLISACLLFAWSIWLARSLRPPRWRATVSSRWFWATAGLTAIVFLQMIFGAFVDGLRAGTTFSTWPLIDGALIPQDLWFFSPWWKNLVENALTAQFVHWLLAYLILLYAAILLLVGRQPDSDRRGIRRATAWIFALALVQGGLGVATVLSAASPPLAIAHMATAFAMVGFLAACMADLSQSRRPADLPELRPGVSVRYTAAE